LAEVHARPSLLGDGEGELREIVLQYSESLGEQILPTYRDLIAQLEEDTVVHIVCECEEQFERLRPALAPLRPEANPIRFTSAGREISVWVRDRFLSLAFGFADPRGWHVLIPAVEACAGADRVNDTTIPELLAERFRVGLDIEVSGLRFEGGTVMGYGGLWESGAETIEEAREQLAEEFGKKLLAVGSEELAEPHDHIDMYLTLVGRNVALLGDPAEPVACLANGRMEKAAELLDRRDPELARNVQPEVDLLSSYRQVREQLETKGFQVERVPIVHLDEENVLTFNNVLMEQRSGRRIVYLPQYGFEDLDEAGIAAWERIGYEVRPVDVSEIYEYGGTLRCVTNVLSRRLPR
jgi:N-dimethylarginine dimethylaminohydrolase